MTSLVEDFHKKHNFPIGIELVEKSAFASAQLRVCARMLKGVAQSFEKIADTDDRMLRAHLLVEELGELIEGLAECDKVKVLDGSADLRYVNEGACVTFGLPHEAAFQEVHRSNMTKAVRQPGDVRLRDKGADYEPPDLEGVLNAAANAEE